MKKSASGPRKSPRFWFVIGILVIISIAVYYELVCHYTPFTSDAYLQAYVTQIAPEVAGWVTCITVANNAFVKQGETLFQIDARPYQYSVDKLKAALVQAVQSVSRLERKKQSIEALIDQRKAELRFAQELYDKIGALEEKGAYAEIKLDEALTKLDARKALLNEAQDQLAEVEEMLEARIGGEHASVTEVRSQLDKAEFDLAHTTVYSPSDGYITNLQLSTGSYVKVGTPVMTIIGSQRWWVVANFKENSLGRIRPGQPAEISLPMYPGRLFKGRVINLDWGIRLGQGEPSGVLADVGIPKDWVRPVQRFPVRLALEEASKEVAPQRVGASATVTIFTEENRVFNGLSRFWLWIDSYLNYIY